jgi:hypothetical protein
MIIKITILDRSVECDVASSFAAFSAKQQVNSGTIPA